MENNYVINALIIATKVSKIKYPKSLIHNIFEFEFGFEVVGQNALICVSILSGFENLTGFYPRF
jgi:hypothetical protein